MSPKLLGEVVAHGSRSVVHAWGRGAVIKVPKPATPASWIVAEARYIEAVRAVGAPAPTLLGLEQVFGRPASVWERVDGPSMWQQVVDRPDRSAAVGRSLAEVQLALFALVPPVTLPDQRDRLTSKIRRSAADIDGSFALTARGPRHHRSRRIHSHGARAARPDIQSQQDRHGSGGIVVQRLRGGPSPRLPAHALLGWKSSTGLPAGSSMRIWRPPGPSTISPRNLAPEAARRSTLASRSATTIWNRFHPPGFGIPPALPAPPTPGSCRSSRKSSLAKPANPGASGRST